nr:hydroxysteroid dehydrogenase-like protein 2 [Saimiri boliviensis boliviensis]
MHTTLHPRASRMHTALHPCVSIPVPPGCTLLSISVPPGCTLLSIPMSPTPGLRDARRSLYPCLRDAHRCLYPCLRDTHRSLYPCLRYAHRSLHPCLRDARRSLHPCLRDAHRSLYPCLRDARRSLYPCLWDARRSLYPRLRDARRSLYPCLQAFFTWDCSTTPLIFPYPNPNRKLSQIYLRRFVQLEHSPLSAALVPAISSDLRKSCYPTPVEAVGGKALPCIVDVRDEQQISGNFVIDENILKEEGIKNFDAYAIKPGHPLLPDFFLDEYPEPITKKMESTGAVPEFKEKKPQPQPKPRLGAVEETFRIVKDSLSDDVVKATQGIYLFELSGEDGGTWFLDLKSKGGNVGYGEPSDQADVVMSMSTDDFVKMFSGKLKPTMAFMSGRLKIKGNMALAIKLEKLVSQMNARL